METVQRLRVDSYKHMRLYSPINSENYYITIRIFILNGDTYLDGDTVSIRSVFSKEANDECEKRINSVAYILDVEGKFMRGIDKDFTLCLYNLTRTYDNDVSFLKDANKTAPKYAI